MEFDHEDFVLTCIQAGEVADAQILRLHQLLDRNEALIGSLADERVAAPSILATWLVEAERAGRAGSPLDAFPNQRADVARLGQRDPSPSLTPARSRLVVALEERAAQFAMLARQEALRHAVDRAEKVSPADRPAALTELEAAIERASTSLDPWLDHVEPQLGSAQRQDGPASGPAPELTAPLPWRLPSSADWWRDGMDAEPDPEETEVTPEPQRERGR